MLKFKYLYKLLPILIIIVLVSFLFGSALFPPQGKILYGGDVYDAYFFWKNYLRESIRSGVVPFWNPYNFSGTPFLAHPNINIFYPLNWIFIIFPLNQSFAIYFFIHLVVAGGTMYWLGRQYTGRIGALAGALTYALGGYFAARIYSGHLEYVDTASWMPLAFGLGRCAIISPNVKNNVWASIGLGILLLSGNELFFLFTVEIVFLYGLYILWKKRGEKKFIVNLFQMGITAVFSIMLAIGLTAIEVLPRLQFIRLSLRSIGVPYSLAGSGSLHLKMIRLFINPLFYGPPNSYNGPWPNLSEYTYYVGIVPIVCILVLVVYFFLSRISSQLRIIKVDKDVWFFIFFVIPIFFLISLGSNIHPNIHEFLWRFTPFYKSLRFPVRHLFVVSFSASIITGVLVGTIKNKFIKLAIVGFLVIDLISFDKHFFRLSDLPTATFDQKLISTLQNDKSLFRVLSDHTVISLVRRDMDLGSASMNKIQTTSDYNSMILSDYYHFIDILNKSPVSSVVNYNVEIPPANPFSYLVDFLNIKYILSDKTADVIGKDIEGKFKLILEGDRYRLYENLTYIPRFVLVGKANIYTDENSLERVLYSDSVDLSKTVLLRKDDIKNFTDIKPNCLSNSNGQVGVVSYRLNRITLSILSDCNSLLSTSEVFYPGWKARVDGKETFIYKSNVAFRSIYIPKGSHRVEFYYSPDIYYLGGIVSLISIGIVIFLFQRGNEKK